MWQVRVGVGAGTVSDSGKWLGFKHVSGSVGGGVFSEIGWKATDPAGHSPVP